MPSFSHAMAQPRSRMLSLHLGGMIIQSQIPMNFIPTQPELNMKLVYIKKRSFACTLQFSGSCPAYSAKIVLKSQTVLDLLIHF